MKSALVRLAEMAFLLAFAWLLITGGAGCQTISGFGRDLQDVTSNYTENADSNR